MILEPTIYLGFSLSLPTSLSLSTPSWISFQTSKRLFLVKKVNVGNISSQHVDLAAYIVEQGIMGKNRCVFLLGKSGGLGWGVAYENQSQFLAKSVSCQVICVKINPSWELYPMQYTGSGNLTPLSNNPTNTIQSGR